MRLIDADKLIEGRAENDPVVIAVKCAETIGDAENNNNIKVCKNLFLGLFSMCNECIMADVCKFKESGDIDPHCKYFKNAMNYKMYGNIYDMFQPIFEGSVK